jgi:hypothetical protein
VSCGLYIIFPSSIYDLWLLLWYLVAIVFSVLTRFTISDYPFGILWPLHCKDRQHNGHKIPKGLSEVVNRGMTDNTKPRNDRQYNGHKIPIYDLWLSFSYLVDIVLSVLPRFTTSDYSFGIMWPFYCLSFLELRLLITLLVSLDNTKSRKDRQCNGHKIPKG